MTVQKSFSGKRTAEIVGITYRQLDYWARTDLVRPSVLDAAGSGSRRAYSYNDLLELKVIKTLLDAGLRLDSVTRGVPFSPGTSWRRRRQRQPRHQRQPVGAGPLEGELIDLQNGQGVLNVLPLAGVKQEIDAAMSRTPPRQGRWHQSNKSGSTWVIQSQSGWNPNQPANDVPT
ncbi:MAG: MerR family transcriptional regulator [Acidimicrobiales bacterium]